jgi:hypothetical protein
MKCKYLNYSIVFLYIVLASIAFIVLPANDDWSSAAYPNFDFTVLNLLPQKAFWRPIENLIGGIIGHWPILFPYLNHFIIVLLFTVNSILVFKLLSKMGVAYSFSIIGAFAALLLPGGMSALFSVDSINQVGSVTFGLLSLYAFRYYRYYCI